MGFYFTKKRLFAWLKALLPIMTVCALFYVTGAFAQDAPPAGAGGTGLGGIADNVVKAFEPLGKMLVGMSYLCGIGFAMAGIFKFKQHKDNPTQIPVGTPIALMLIGVALVFLPNWFMPGGETLFGKDAKAGGYTGEGAKGIGGADDS